MCLGNPYGVQSLSSTASSEVFPARALSGLPSYRPLSAWIRCGCARIAEVVHDIGHVLEPLARLEGLWRLPFDLHRDGAFEDIDESGHRVGVRLMDLPGTAEKVFAALQAKRSG